jgi:hypothetical protein
MEAWAMNKQLMFFSGDALATVKINKKEMWEGLKNSPNSYEWIFPLLGDDCLVSSPYLFDFDFAPVDPNDPGASDLENTIRLYETLKGIPRNVVFCEQFLSGFIFTYGYPYFFQRWSSELKDDEENWLRHIFFLDGPRRAVAVNAVGRLFARGCKLIDDSLGNEHKYDLLKRAYAMPISLQVEYNTYADNPKIFQAFVETVLEFSESHGKLVDDDVRALAHHLSMIQGTSLAECLTKEEIKNRLSDFLPLYFAHKNSDIK